MGALSVATPGSDRLRIGGARLIPERWLSAPAAPPPNTCGMRCGGDMSDNPFSNAASPPDYLTPQEALAFLKAATGRPESVLAGQLKDAVRKRQVGFGVEWPDALRRSAFTNRMNHHHINWETLRVSVTFNVGIDPRDFVDPSRRVHESRVAPIAHPEPVHLPLTIERRTLENFAEELRRRNPPMFEHKPNPHETDVLTYRTGAQGRPSSVHLVLPEMRARAERGELLPSLSAEAAHLSKWLGEAHPKAAPMTVKAIRNNLALSDEHKRLKGSPKPRPK
jgi:hypothetical protein